MALLDAFCFEGKRVLVVGGATGMGAAAAKLAQEAGGEVVVMDRARVTLEGVASIELDLAVADSIVRAVTVSDGLFQAVLMCAGVDQGTPGIERINFVGHRHLINQMLARDQIPRGRDLLHIVDGWNGLGAELRVAVRGPRHR